MATGDMCGVGAVFMYNGPTCVSSQTSDDMFWQYNKDFTPGNGAVLADPFLQTGMIGLKCPGHDPATGKYPGGFDGMKPYVELLEKGFVSCMDSSFSTKEAPLNPASAFHLSGTRKKLNS